MGRRYETGEKQARSIEDKRDSFHDDKMLHRVEYTKPNDNNEIHRVYRKPGKYSGIKESRNEVNTENTIGEKLCFNYGNSWPHSGGNSRCPAKGKICRKCNKQNLFANVCESRT